MKHRPSSIRAGIHRILSTEFFFTGFRFGDTLPGFFTRLNGSKNVVNDFRGGRQLLEVCDLSRPPSNRCSHAMAIDFYDKRDERKHAFFIIFFRVLCRGKSVGCSAANFYVKRWKFQRFSLRNFRFTGFRSDDLTYQWTGRLYRVFTEFCK